MKSGIAAGLTRTRRFDVNEDRTIGFMGEGLRIYATPLISWAGPSTCASWSTSPSSASACKQRRPRWLK